MYASLRNQYTSKEATIAKPVPKINAQLAIFSKGSSSFTFAPLLFTRIDFAAIVESKTDTFWPFSFEKCHNPKLFRCNKHNLITLLSLLSNRVIFAESL